MPELRSETVSLSSTAMVLMTTAAVADAGQLEKEKDNDMHDDCLPQQQQQQQQHKLSMKCSVNTTLIGTDNSSVSTDLFGSNGNDDDCSDRRLQRLPAAVVESTYPKQTCHVDPEDNDGGATSSNSSNRVENKLDCGREFLETIAAKGCFCPRFEEDFFLILDLYTPLFLKFKNWVFNNFLIINFTA